MDPSSIFSDDDGDDNFDQFLNSVKNEKDASSKATREKDFLVDDDEEEFEPDSTQDPDDSFDLDDTLPKKKRKAKEKQPPQQCHGPSCVRQARKRSKYCSGMSYPKPSLSFLRRLWTRDGFSTHRQVLGASARRDRQNPVSRRNRAGLQTYET